MIIPIVVLVAVFALIAVRQVGPLRLKMWHVMLGGALAVLATGQISLPDAWRAINADVLIFLFCMFVAGRALEESGYLAALSYRCFRRARSMDALVLLVLFGVAAASAVLMNDTLAIVGTPVVLLLARKHKADAKMLLLALCFAVTIGSAMSPIGNPQNLLIALTGTIANPFLAFASRLAVPTAINLLVTYGLLRIFYKESFHATPLAHEREPIRDASLAVAAKISLCAMLLLIAAKVALVAARSPVDIPLAAVALAGAVPALLHRRRVELVRGIDWGTLVFFAAMFVLMRSVWDTGLFQRLIAATGLGVGSLAAIFLAGVLVSQLVSNVPLVALYLPLLASVGAGESQLLALAAGSTVAGNLLILGAASNVIVIQNAERKGETITFWEFARIGVPLTVLNVAVYWIFLAWR